MVELYWITRIAALSDMGAIILYVTSIVGAIVGFFFGIGLLTADSRYDREEFYNSMLYQAVKKYFKHWFVAFIIGLFIVEFAPTKKELITIYGLGGTIDYIKSNDKAKELPDKVVDALTRYIDSIEKKE